MKILAIILIMSALLLTGAAGRPALPLSESFEATPGTDLLWRHMADMPLGDSDAPPPPGVMGWGAQCLRFMEGNDMAGYTTFEATGQVSMTWNVFIAPQFELANSGWYIHLGSTMNKLPGLFVWGGAFDGGHGLSLEDGGTTLATISITTGEPHTVGVSADVLSGYWLWTIDGAAVASGYRSWPTDATFDGISYAAWTWRPAEPYDSQAWFDNILLTTDRIPDQHLFMPVIWN